MAEHRSTIDAMRDLLLQEPPPSWSEGPETWGREVAPGDGLRQLRTLLLAEALNSGADDALTGLVWLEAAWRLDGGFGGWWLSSPKLAVLRRIDAVDDVWAWRLAESDFRAQYRAVELREADDILRVLTEPDGVLRMNRTSCVSSNSTEEPDPWARRLGTFVQTSIPVRTYVWLATRDAVKRLHGVLDRVPSLDPCELMDASHFETAENPSRWESTGDAFFLHQPSVWRHVGRAMLEAELTAKVLEARRVRAATGAWPASIPGIERSACKQGSWRYAAPAGGGVTIEFVSELDLRGLREPGPLRFRSYK